jgi:hypothetical protein
MVLMALVTTMATSPGLRLLKPQTAPEDDMSRTGRLSLYLR